jgi:hypothetical protein
VVKTAAAGAGPEAGKGGGASVAARSAVSAANAKQ